MQAQIRTDYVAEFEDALEQIDKLHKTPELIKNVAAGALQAALRQEGLTRQAKHILENSLGSLNNISSQSIDDNYRVIYSQMCILAVSSLEALLSKYFERAADQYTNLATSNKRLAELKVSVAEVIASELKFGGKLGKLILEKDNLKFQDLQTIKKIFLTYFDKAIELPSKAEKRACFYLEVRHVLVRKGGKADKKFIRATGSMSANVKNLAEGDLIELDQQDWEEIKSCFKTLVAIVTRPLTT